MDKRHNQPLLEANLHLARLRAFSLALAGTYAGARAHPQPWAQHRNS